MSTWPLVKFVDAPATTATVRFDCNDLQATAPRQAVEFDPGVPTLEGDPDAVGQQWGFRSPALTVRVKGTKAAALAALSALSREQLRRTNWVLFQLSADTQPLWFKTYRTGYESLSLERVDVDKTSGRQGRTPDAWEIRVPLVADAFAYGARVAIPTVQMVQAPADLAGPTRYALRYVLPAIKGDAPAPLRVTITPATGGGTQPNGSWLIGCINGSATMADQLVEMGSADATIAGTSAGLGAAVVDATYFGGSYRPITIAAATPNLLNRFMVNFGTPPLGRYKVQLRCVYTAAATKTLLFRMAPWLGGTSGTAPNSKSVSVDVFSTDTKRLFWVDLGEVNIPFGQNPPTGGGGTSPTLYLGVDIGTADGSAASVNCDAMRLIPVDGPHVTSANLLRHSAFIVLQFGRVGTFDADTEQFWTWSIGGALPYSESTTIVNQGSYPVADPAAAKSILLVQGLDSGQGSSSAGSYITTLNVQAAVDVSYLPRYLHLGDGT